MSERTEYRYKAFITIGQKYLLLDEEGDIRGTSCSIDGIVKLKEEYGWGRIFEFTWDKKCLKVGREIE